MTSAEEKLCELLSGDLPEEAKEANANKSFLDWFLQQFRTTNNGAKVCNIEEFAVYVLNTVRQQTEIHLQPQESDTTQCPIPARSIKAQSACAKDNVSPLLRELGNTPETSGIHCIKANEAIKVNDSASDRTFPQMFASSTSTPVRRNPNHSSQRRTSSSFGSAEKSMRNNSTSSSLCFGDFLVLSTPNSNRLSKKKTPQQQQALADTPNGKQRKRVVPTTISTCTSSTTGSPFGNCSSFSNENNILKISEKEIDDISKCSIMQARRSLRLNASELSKEAQQNVSKLGSLQPTGQTDLQVGVESKTGTEEPTEIISKIDFENVTDIIVLQRLANIYAVLIDLNLTTNILREISFLLNLLNVNEQKHHAKLNTDAKKQPFCLKSDVTSPKGNSLNNKSVGGLWVLKNVTNCVYFALLVLNQQRNNLAMLDSKSLGVVLSSERIATLDPHLKSYLDSVQLKKQQMNTKKTLHNNAFARFSKSFKSVYYREEDDVRHNFPTNNEFGAFKTQRDLFYKMLKLWEENHLNPLWRFSEVTPIIVDIFKRSENFINMAHFAKLFVSQLLISARDTSSPEEIGLEMDLQKFSKLTQRLVTPSNFSVDYQFPRNQAFFRDFIGAARSVAFIEQLKMALYQELITLNDSTFEELKLNAESEDHGVTTESNCHTEFIVCPEILESMLILAKFLGFTTGLPFNQSFNGSLTPDIEKKQLLLRSLFQPNFNVCHILLEAIKRRKLLITLPWLVQYLAMLDHITLQLDKFVEVMQIMFGLYARFCMGETKHLPTSVFIIRCCLGWLFEENPVIAEQYYSYRTVTMQGECCTSSVPAGTVSALPTVEQSVESNEMLECILNVACPFLAEFRVSIMPAKYTVTKYVSRTGRYRYITTRVAELTALPQLVASNNAGTDVVTPAERPGRELQNKLVDAFLHSQNGSMRRLIEFVVERVFKSVVKDAQHKVLLPSKNIADNKVNAITSCNIQQVSHNVAAIYEAARREALQQWHAILPEMMRVRIESALDALLPAETTLIIKKTYFMLIRCNVEQKVQQWCDAHMVQNKNFYCSNLDEMVQKICKANQKEKQESSQSSELNIVNDVLSVSDLIDDLQYWLHCTSMRPDIFTQVEPIVEFLERVPLAFENTLPTVFYRLFGTNIVQLMQHIITRHPCHLTNELLEAACNIWLTPQLRSSYFNSTKSNADSGGDVANEAGDNILTTTSCGLPSIFDGLITISFVESMGQRRICYDMLKKLLLVLIKRYLITVDFVNVQLVPIFKEDWHPSILNEISNMLQAIAQEAALFWSDDVTGYGDNSDTTFDPKSHLFMEVLANLSRDVDDF